ncbi:MAG: SPOR domain-containing protein [Marinilabiliaceae bacterium]|nr:SPOR domain-containing protein [Marinilabiliaceae bacterium]
MKKNSLKGVMLAFLCFSCFSFSNILAQNEVEKILDEGEVKKFTKADKLIARGDEILDKTVGIEKEIEALRNADGRIKTRKIDKRSKASAKYKMQAAIYYKDGYHTKIKVLDKRLKAAEKAGDTKASSARDEVKELEKKARKQYNKAENLISYEEAVEMVELAQENQLRALDVMAKALGAATAVTEIQEEPVAEVIEEIPVAIQDSVSVPEPEMEATQQTASETREELATEETTVSEGGVPPVGTKAAVVAGTTVAVVAAAGSEEEVPVPVEEPVVDTNLNVFFSIQILAGKSKISEAQLAQTYSGSKKIIEMTGDGWHRYSIGKFDSVEKARQAQKEEGVKGFIVAYKDGKRISVKEATELLK